MIKNICVVINNRANYARVKSLLKEINLSSKLKIIFFIYTPSNFEKSIKLLNVLQNIFNNSRRLFLIS